MSSLAMTHDEQVSYLERLIGLTKAGKIAWDRDPNTQTDFVFLARLKSFTVWIISEDKDDYHPYRFTIDRYVGEQGLADSSNELVVIESSAADESINGLLQDLYSVVKPKVLGYEDLSRQLFEELDSLE